MGWNGIGVGWPNASAYSGPPAPTNVYYLIDGWCSESEFPTNTYTTQLVDPNIYHTGEFVYSPTLYTGVLLGPTQSTPLEEVAIIGPVYSGCPVPALVSYSVYDCQLGEYYTTGPYEEGTITEGGRVYTQSGNYGYVNSIVEPPQEGNTDTEAFPIGYVDYRCNDCSITFNFELQSDGSDWYLDLYVNNDGEVPFQSDINELIIDVNYSAYLTSEEDPPITMSGSVTFEIASYNVPSGVEGWHLHEQYAFSASEDYNVETDSYGVTSMSVNPIALGPYDTGWDVPNKYVTDYGNVWTFYYPT